MLTARLTTSTFVLASATTTTPFIAASDGIVSHTPNVLSLEVSLGQLTSGMRLTPELKPALKSSWTCYASRGKGDGKDGIRKGSRSNKDVRKVHDYFDALAQKDDPLILMKESQFRISKKAGAYTTVPTMASYFLTLGAMLAGSIGIGVGIAILSGITLSSIAIRSTICMHLHKKWLRQEYTNLYELIASVNEEAQEVALKRLYQIWKKYPVEKQQNFFSFLRYSLSEAKSAGIILALKGGTRKKLK